MHTAPQPDRRSRTGLWLIGGRGSVATTAIVGAALVEAGLSPQTGFVTALEPFQQAGLGRATDVVFGGHDIATVPLQKRAEILTDGGVLPQGAVRAVTEQLDRVDAEILAAPGAGTPPSVALERLVADLRTFRNRHGLDRVVVVDVSSTEAPVPAHPAHRDLAGLRRALERGEDVLPPSSLYAMAAFEAGCPHVSFTPSTGARLPALDELAQERGLPYAGSDGKTGETLLRTALAPMFATRNLTVRSWSGTNLLGGGDGETLADPAHAASKLDSKSGVLGALLGYDVVAPLHIDNVPDMGDWKTSWDHVSFEGFLGTRMRMQVTWEGCDSALAAPLVLDLAHLLAHAHGAGLSGPVPELAFFFKDPLGRVPTHGVEQQFATLVRWAEGLGGGR
ncbi:inositol-3-phosphate synthase [Blastococcus capsensis]|uniref:inositol-3-phosphate synthase n=1 Tax=Blastococcus capsensis TaxID=1564163 RepID=UPI002540BC04|nr:inositol-3-phosphate synthase [Blastococcus capsensis]MDK3256793.1 inositol-3-phosphate synthase [Blastococcus capsensis]